MHRLSGAVPRVVSTTRRSRIKSLVKLLGFLLGLCPAGALLAQAGNTADTVEARKGDDAKRDDDEALAYRYAPTLHFAPQEKYLPMLPFFNAFLRLNDTNPVLTPELAGTMQLMDGGKDSLILWNALDADYKLLRARRKPAPPNSAGAGTSPGTAECAPNAAVLFYRVDRLKKKESKNIWMRLRADFQLWARLTLPDTLRALADTNMDAMPELYSMEYYAYYIRDFGLTGHAQDLEKFFVFVPKPNLAVQIMVGAAHSVVTPNNTVILAREDSQETSLVYRPHALVEYGGHSFSPDVPPTGSFTLGWDINWRASERSWGVRDIQAVLATGFSGDYKASYTLPRTDSLGVILTPWIPSVAATDHLPAGETCGARGTRQVGSYALIPIKGFQILFDALSSTEGDSAQRVERVRQVWNDLGPRLERSLGPARRFPDDPVQAGQVYQRLRLWLKKDLADSQDVKLGGKVSRLKGSATKMRPWLANEYTQEPAHIMKAWLYRPQDASRKCQFRVWPLKALASSLYNFSPVHLGDFQYVEAGLRYGIGKKFRHTGLVLEATDAYHCLERATKLNVPGTLSFGMAFSPRDIEESPVEAQLRYQPRFFSPQALTWSLGLSYVFSFDSTETAEIRADPSRERSRFRVRPAVVIMPIGMIKGATWDANWGHLVLSSLAIRVGPQVDLFHPSRSMAWQVELVVRPNPKFVPRGTRESLKCEN